MSVSFWGVQCVLPSTTYEDAWWSLLKSTAAKGGHQGAEVTAGLCLWPSDSMRGAPWICLISAWPYLLNKVSSLPSPYKIFQFSRCTTSFIICRRSFLTWRLRSRPHGLVYDQCKSIVGAQVDVVKNKRQNPLHLISQSPKGKKSSALMSYFISQGASTCLCDVDNIFFVCFG